MSPAAARAAARAAVGSRTLSRLAHCPLLAVGLRNCPSTTAAFFTAAAGVGATWRQRTPLCSLHAPRPGAFAGRCGRIPPPAPIAMATTHGKDFPAQQQGTQPGLEHVMKPRPEAVPPVYKAARKLEGKKVLITGGDSGIGRAVAVAFSLEGADVGFTFVPDREEKDAEETMAIIRERTKGERKVTAYGADCGFEKNCKEVVDSFLKDHGRKIDVLVNNCAEQHINESVEDITEAQLERTFRTNIFSYFFFSKLALPHMPPGTSSIINTTSVNAYKGNARLLDYTATKGAIVAFTRGMALQLLKKGIRVNGVAPGPIWTPLIASSFPPEKVEGFGQQAPMGEAGHPDQVAPAYVFLASDDGSYFTGQVLHPNGGMIVNA